MTAILVTQSLDDQISLVRSHATGEILYTFQPDPSAFIGEAVPTRDEALKAVYAPKERKFNLEALLDAELSAADQDWILRLARDPKNYPDAQDPRSLFLLEAVTPVLAVA